LGGHGGRPGELSDRAPMRLSDAVGMAKHR